MLFLQRINTLQLDQFKRINQHLILILKKMLKEKLKLLMKCLIKKSSYLGLEVYS